MLDRTKDDRHEPSVVDSRRRFTQQAGIPYENCVYQVITYAADRTYDEIKEVGEPDTEGCLADVLYTERPELGLFLPVADCVATVIYDPGRQALALAHIGTLENSDIFWRSSSGMRRSARHNKASA